MKPATTMSRDSASMIVARAFNAGVGEDRALL